MSEARECPTTRCKSMQFSLLGFLLMVASLFLSLSQPAHADANAKTVMALIPVHRGTYTPVDDAVLVELESILSKDRSFILVERQQLERILAERNMTLSGLTQRSNQLQLGRWLTADVLLFIDKQNATPDPVYELTITEARTGIVLGSRIIPLDAALGAMEETMQWIATASAKRNIPLQERHLVSFAGVRSVVGEGLLDTTAVALTGMIQLGLKSIPGLTLLDREHVEHLRTEIFLSSEDRDILATVILLDGGIRHANKDNALDLTLRIRLPGGSNVTQTTITVATNPVPAAYTAIFTALHPLLCFSNDATRDYTLSQEARLFHEQAAMWAYHGHIDRAVDAATTAYGLDSSQSNRLLLAQCLIKLHAKDTAIDLRGYELWSEYIDTKLLEIAAGRDHDLQIAIPPAHSYSRKTPDPNADKLMDIEERMFRKLLEHYRKHNDKVGSKNSIELEFWHNPYWKLWKQDSLNRYKYPPAAFAAWSGLFRWFNNGNMEAKIDEKMLSDYLSKNPAARSNSEECRVQKKFTYVPKKFRFLPPPNFRPLSTTNSAWNKFSVKKLNIPLEKAPLDILATDTMLYSATYYERYASGLETSQLEIALFALPSGRSVKSLRLPLPDSFKPYDPVRKQMVLCEGMIYIAAGDRLFCMTPDASSITTIGNLPGKEIGLMCAAENKVFLYFRDKVSMLACFDPKTKTVSLLASSAAMEKMNFLDGEPFSCVEFAADPIRKCIWIAGATDQPGIWSYTPSTGVLSNLTESPRVTDIRPYTCRSLGGAIGAGVLIFSYDLVYVERRARVQYGLPPPLGANFEVEALGDFLFLGTDCPALALAVARLGEKYWNTLSCDDNGGRIPPVLSIESTGAALFVLCKDLSTYLVIQNASTKQIP